MDKEIFWYEIAIGKLDDSNGYPKERFKLRVRLEVADMYELARQIVEYAVSDRPQALPAIEEPNKES